MVRLNRFLAQVGIASRREADRMISEGSVEVNGRIVYELGIKVDPLKDKVKVKGKLVQVPTEKTYVAFYKPRQVVTTLSDPEGRPCIQDYIDQFKIRTRLFPVGRLDWNSEGLLLLTNDGDLAQKILHPKEEITKTYLCKLSRPPRASELSKLKRGVSIPQGGRVRAKDVGFSHYGTSREHPWIRVIVTEGKKHQIRAMFAKLGIDVFRLKRVAIGQLKLGSLKPGEMRFLEPREIKKLFQPDTFSRRHQISAQKRRL